MCRRRVSLEYGTIGDKTFGFAMCGTITGDSMRYLRVPPADILPTLLIAATMKPHR